MDWKRLERLLEEEGLDAALASSPENVYYTSHFPSLPSAVNRGLYLLLRSQEAVSVLLPKGGEPLLLLSVGLAGIAEAYSSIKEMRFSVTGMHIDWPPGARRTVSAPSPRENLVLALKELGLEQGTLGVEMASLSAMTFDHLKDALPSLRLRDARGLFLRLRLVKSPEEVTLMREATHACQRGIRAALELARAGVEEQKLLSAYQEELRRLGCEWESSAIGAGHGSGEAYHLAGPYRLKAGDILRFDVTAIRRGYFSDLSRSASIGPPPEEARRLYEALRGAVEAMVSSVRPGLPVKELFRMGMEKVRGAGYPSYQRGNLGHGLGLGHYEEPFVTAENETPLQAGMVLALEAPYYVAGRFGLNVENNVLVTQEGYEVLDDLSLDLVRCD